MKTIFTICTLTGALGAFLIWRDMQMPSRYGMFTGAPKAEVADLIQRPKDFAGKTVLVEGAVTEQCKSMGCFFFLPSGASALRVDLEHIAMNAPMHELRPVRVEGRIVAFNGGYQLYASAVEFQ